MCSLCGVLRNEHWADEGAGRRARVIRTALLERVLGRFGLTVREWAGQYVVSDGKGGSEVTADLAGVWVAAERLAGRPLDPLSLLAREQESAGADSCRSIPRPRRGQNPEGVLLRRPQLPRHPRGLRGTAPDRTPVALVTGYLGSGKTTLIRSLLEDARLGETAVIVNELGEIGIDHAILRRVDERTVLLASGCVCCTLRGDLADELRDLLDRRATGEIPPFVRVVVETTGVADPAPIVQTLVSEPLVRHQYALESVIATVDAQHGLRGEESERQVAAADVLVVTKGDLADPADVERELGALNPVASVVRAVHGDVDPALLLGPSQALSGGGELCGDSPQALSGRGGLCVTSTQALSGGAGGGHEHRHEDGVAAVSLVLDGPVDWLGFGVWLTMLLHARGREILRVKGLLDVGGEGPLLVDAVQHVVHPPEHLEAWPDEDRRSRLVLIGRRLDPERLERSLREFCRAG